MTVSEPWLFSTTESEPQPKWPEIVFEIYRSSRKNPAWETIKSLHDQEDQQYFEMLDDLIEREKIEIYFEVPR